jgi:hypothetical protein
MVRRGIVHPGTAVEAFLDQLSEQLGREIDDSER